jgi:(p)ppGpp synthase/HD superfamily hydrolase
VNASKAQSFMDIVEKARVFATAAHVAVGQVRKYTGEAYICHPAAVAALVRSASEEDATVAAAWLHDVVEDTGVTLETVVAEFGPAVANLVEQVTDISKPSDGNRAHRKMLDRHHSALACPAAKSIKLADMIDNLPSIISGDRKFAKVYVAEQRLLLAVLVEGSPRLFAQAEGLLAGANL